MEGSMETSEESGPYGLNGGIEMAVKKQNYSG